jgi:hypothetical protein
LLYGEPYLFWHRPFTLFTLEQESAIEICRWIEC